MQLVYVGPHLEGVEIAASGQVAYPSMPLEVEDELAKGLLQQPTNWQEHKEPVKGSKGDA